MVILAMPFFIAPYRHVKPLDRQTYHRHHRQARETAHAKNGERIFCLSLPSIGAKLVFHKFVKNLNHQASNNKALAKSEQRIEQPTAYGSIQKPNTQQHAKPLIMGHW